MPPGLGSINFITDTGLSIRAWLSSVITLFISFLFKARLSAGQQSLLLSVFLLVWDLLFCILFDSCQAAYNLQIIQNPRGLAYIAPHTSTTVVAPQLSFWQIFSKPRFFTNGKWEVNRLRTKDVPATNKELYSINNQHCLGQHGLIGGFSSLLVKASPVSQSSEECEQLEESKHLVTWRAIL